MPFDEARETDGKYMYIRSKEYDLFWKCHYKCRIVKKNKQETFLQLTHLLMRLFEYSAEKRITINQIRSHAWFKNVRGYNGDEYLRAHFESTMKNMQYQLVTQQLSLQVQGSKNRYTTIQAGDVSSLQMSQRSTKFKFSSLKYVFLFVYIFLSIYCKTKCEINFQQLENTCICDVLYTVTAHTEQFQRTLYLYH